MAEIKVKCPYCGSEEISLYGKNTKGKQRYLCKNQNCKRKTFILDYTYNACKPNMKETAFKMRTCSHREYVRIFEHNLA